MSGLPQKIKEIWREIALVVSLSVFVILMYYFIADRPEGMYAQSFMILGTVGSGAAVFLLLRSLWRDKWRRVTAAIMQRAFGRVQRLIERISEKLGIKRSDKTVLAGKTRVTFNKITLDSEKEELKEKKPPRWKQLESDRARMRFLYRQMIGSKIKKGARIYGSQTPSEICNGQDKSDAESELFDIYIECRYDDRRAPDTQTVLKLKDELKL